MYPALTDRQLIRENIREKCIYEHIGDESGEWDDHEFFNYLYFIHMVCLKQDMNLTDECADRMMDKVNIPVDIVNKCMEDSFVNISDWQSYNPMLAEDREHINDQGIVMNPSLTINSHLYTEELKGEKVFRAICQAYSIDQMPKVCDPEEDI